MLNKMNSTYSKALFGKKIYRIILCIFVLVSLFYVMLYVSSFGFSKSAQQNLYPMLTESPRVQPTSKQITVSPIFHKTTDSLRKFYGHSDLLRTPEAFLPRTHKVTSLNYTYIIRNEAICPRNSPITLVVMLLTRPEDFIQRQAVRETWGRIVRGEPWPGRKLRGSVRNIFLLGKAEDVSIKQRITEEAKIHKDIVQADFKESYFNLTLKVLMGMKWIQTYCSKAQFVMKMDQDAFTDIPRILNLLTTIEMTNKIYGCYFYTDSVARNTNNKAAVSYKAYSPKYYPPHVKGNMYVMPYQLAMNIVNVSEYFPYVNIEDAHITGILAKVFDSRHLAIPKDLYDPYPTKDPELCDFCCQKKITAQRIRPKVMYELWNRIENCYLCGITNVTVL